MLRQTFSYGGAALLLLGLLFCAPHAARAQQQDDYETERARAFELYEQNNYTAAKEVLERLAVVNPRDREVLATLGILVIAHSANLKDAAERRKERVRGRLLLVQAKELGADNTLLRTLLETVPADGGDSESPLSKVAAAEEAMHDAEAAFARGDFPKALAAYQRALDADPNFYEAALFTGDVYRKTNEPEKAAQWFARAIKINPDVETAYRYWGEMLMQQDKLDEARDKLLEAYILSPYYRLTAASLIAWANRKQVKLAHPQIEIPTTVTSPKKGETNITLGPSVLGGKDDGTSAWMMYGIVRANWMNEKFAKAYPDEKTYRHSLAEEADALRVVLASVEQQFKDKNVKQLDPALARLKGINDAGLLEAYLLLARADEGIAQDYPAYLKSNRDKLRRYAVEYVLTGGGR